jgi:hypothetical protein
VAFNVAIVNASDEWPMRALMIFGWMPDLSGRSVGVSHVVQPDAWETTPPGGPVEP